MFTDEGPVMRSNEDLAALWVKGLSGDLQALAEVMSPEARVWHSHDAEWLTLAESGRRMAEQATAGNAPVQGFVDIRAQATSTGVLVQAQLAAGALGLDPVHIVQVLTAVSGTIHSVEEYIAPQTPLVLES